MTAAHRLSAVATLVALGALSSFANAACGAPAGARRTDDGSESSGDEDDDGRGDRDDEHDLAVTGGRWAPRASIARIEDIPRAGRVEERPSRTGAVRVIALLPMDGTGNHIIELIGLPALARDQVVASVRAAHDAPRWSGCTEVIFVADGEEYAVDETTHELGVTTLGVMEAIQGRFPVERLEAAAAGETLSVKSCEEQWELASGAAVLREFLERFRALRPEQDPEAAVRGSTGGEANPDTTESTNPAIVDSPRP